MKFLPRIALILATLLLASTCIAKPYIRFSVHGLTEKKATDNITARINTLIQNLGLAPSREQINELLSELPDQTKKALQPYGFFKAEITMTTKQHRRGVEVTLNVVQGPRVHVRNVNFSVIGPGVNDPIYIAILKNSDIHLDDPLDIDKYNAMKRQLFDAAQNSGYAHAVLKQALLEINLKHYYADMRLVFDTGPRYYFGEVSFHSDVIGEALLRRYLTFKTGEPFSTKKVLALQEAYNSSNYFEQVVVHARVKHPDGYFIPIVVHLKPRPSMATTFGAGYGTDTGVRGSVAWDWRYINAAGHNLQSLLQVSRVQSYLQFRYNIPGVNPLTDVYQIASTTFYQNRDKFDSVGSQLGFTSTTNWGTWRRSTGISALYEHILNKTTNQVDRNTHWLYPHINLRKVVADDVIDASNGYMINVTTQGAVRKIFSEQNFLQVQLDAKVVKTFFETNRFIARSSVGATAINDVNGLAPSLQFYAGGSQSVRGYGYQEIGPGKYLMTSSAELQHLIAEKWYLSVFYDMGAVFDDHFRDNLKRSIGVGVVRRSRVGSINFGIARPFDNKNQSISIVFSMGPDLS